ncbi:uncharacterized protein Z518_06205 [Rhinocladiella mackenziei CBS 650.93]|uniref:Peptidase A1 domain-containing protein n=1 Tax=Rhinocladiella mackenziei CBS 650.93 TaxID=1442369 RepID=A0A0D2H4I3_9EURO|nr:uncharacterized protein Z518_06205 [Rhinocladiella mackenziei CBS 650.93]KIX05333.1 hypothetical protein Z518_06205 [Rhinocladiella mackenziei CBS 650.93]
MSLPTCQNSAEPLLLAISNNNVSSDGQAAPAWGVEMGIGLPLQRFSIWPSISDLTVVASEDECTSSVDYDCLAQLGGTYDPSRSTTSVESDQSTWNGTLAEDSSYSTYNLWNDVFTFGSNDTMAWGLPFATYAVAGDMVGNSLGIGRESPFLQAVIDSNAAPIRSWGLWPGSRAYDQPIDGLLVVGGYDTARVTGEFTSFPSLDGCYTCLQIEDLSWETDSGSISLFNGSVSALQVSLNPWSETLQMPQELWESFAQVTDGVYDPTFDRLTYLASSTPNGNLTVSVKDGYKSSIPASELFTFPRYYDSMGNYTTYNETYKRALIVNYTNLDTEYNYLATWGMPFLTMNYLVMDVEAKEFRLAEAVRQDFANQGGAFPTSLCTGGPPVDSPTPPPDDGDGTPIGAIVGGVVGGVGGLLLIALGMFLFFRRRKRRGQSAPQTAALPPPQNYHQPAPPSAPVMYPAPGGSAAMYPSPAHGGTYPAPGPIAGYHPGPYPVMSQVDYGAAPPPQQGGYQVYSSPALPRAEVASSTAYSDAATTTTAVQELPSPNNNAGEWRGSQVSSNEMDSSNGKGMAATATSPVDMWKPQQ